MDYYTGDYFNNSTTITLIPVRNDMLIMRSFASLKMTRIPVQWIVTSLRNKINYIWEKFFHSMIAYFSCLEKKSCFC